MNESFDLAAIADRIGVPVRRLRYIVDQGLLPGGTPSGKGRGSARRYLPFEAFGIACAAWMLKAGLRRALVRDCLKLLCSPKEFGSRDPRRVPLYSAFWAQEVVRLEVGDWVNVRLVGTRDNPNEGYSTGWRQVSTGAPVGPYEPDVLVSINTASLRNQLTG